MRKKSEVIATGLGQTGFVVIESNHSNTLDPNRRRMGL